MSDWSSDVCSSDLVGAIVFATLRTLAVISSRSAVTIPTLITCVIVDALLLVALAILTVRPSLGERGVMRGLTQVIGCAAIKGGGGLGVLAADTRRVAEKLEVPFVVVTPFYRSESHQKIDGLSQNEYSEKVSPQDYGFEYIDEVTVSSANFPDSSLSIFRKTLGSTQFITISEPKVADRKSVV